jgi:hypothetical protein
MRSQKTAHTPENMSEVIESRLRLRPYCGKHTGKVRDCVMRKLNSKGRCTRLLVHVQEFGCEQQETLAAC